MLEEGHDHRGVEVGDEEIGRGCPEAAVRETHEQLEGIAVGGDRVDAGPSLFLQTVSEKRLEDWRDGRHDVAPRWRCTRSAARSSNSGVAVKYQ